MDQKLQVRHNGIWNRIMAAVMAEITPHSIVLQLSCRQFLNLVTWDASKFDSMLSWSDQGIPRRPKGIVMYAIFPVPPSSLVMTQVKEKPENYLLVDISLLPTFHFLPPPYIFVPISPSSLLCTSPHPFFTEWSPWIMGNVSLKVLEKSFNLFSKKGTSPEIIT